MAGGVVARLASRMINTPQDLLTGQQGSLGGLGRLQLPTSIDSLKPSNPFVTSMQSLPIQVPFHSIIGDNTGQGRGQGSTDGVVDYWSSHVDGAQSEVVINSDHSVHTKPMAIQELARILQQHTAALSR